MGMRIEWFDARHTTVEVLPEGSEVGEFEIYGEVGIVFAADGGMVLEGSYEDVKTLLRAALRKLRAMEWDSRSLSARGRPPTPHLRP